MSISTNFEFTRSCMSRDWQSLNRISGACVGKSGFSGIMISSSRIALKLCQTTPLVSWVDWQSLGHFRQPYVDFLEVVEFWPWQILHLYGSSMGPKMSLFKTVAYIKHWSGADLRYCCRLGRLGTKVKDGSNLHLWSPSRLGQTDNPDNRGPTQPKSLNTRKHCILKNCKWRRFQPPTMARVTSFFF